MNIFTIEHSKTSMYQSEFNDRKKEFSTACMWLADEMGFPYKSTRMGDYERLLKTFINPSAQVPIESDLLDDFYKFMQAATEACQIIRLWNTFKSGENEGLKKRIKQVMAGKSLRVDAIKANKKGQSDDPARDFAFELNIASRFVKGGYEVDLTDDCDVVVKIGQDTLFVECKRIKSLKKLGARINVASKQIDTRIGKDRNNKYGLIALDVTDLIIPNGTITVASDISLYDMNIKNAITDFTKEYQYISDRNIGRNVAGVFFEFSSSAFLYDSTEELILGFGRAACMSRKASQSKKSLAIVNRFIDKIANQDL